MELRVTSKFFQSFATPKPNLQSMSPIKAYAFLLFWEKQK